MAETDGQGKLALRQRWIRVQGCLREAVVAVFAMACGSLGLHSEYQIVWEDAHCQELVTGGWRLKDPMEEDKIRI